ncbi:MAG: hypothetical protein KGK10_00620 [Rhodospirillales bacterium]|nr:hypothetical protein [Rhodospirillales bacterium]
MRARLAAAVLPVLLAASAPSMPQQAAPAPATPLTPGPDACRGIGPVPQPLPEALVRSFLRAFGLKAPILAQGAVVRCASGRLLACTPGANLPCGHADIRRTLPAADLWCRHHPAAASVPAFVVGHDTLYAWRCQGTQGVVAARIAHADADGYVAEYWRPLRP